MTTNIKIKAMCEKAFKDSHNVDDFLYKRIELWLQKAYDLGHSDGYAQCVYDTMEQQSKRGK